MNGKSIISDKTVVVILNTAAEQRQ